MSKTENIFAWQEKYGDLVRPCWRVILCMGLGYVLVGLGLYPFLPESFWFSRLWVGGVVGNFLGFCVGLYWYLRFVKPLPKGAIKYITFFTLMITTGTALGLFIQLPDIYSQERERNFLRSLSTRDISQVTINFSSKQLELTDAQSITSFCGFLNEPREFGGNWRGGGSIRKGQITIYYDDESITYQADVFEKHSKDIILRYKTDVRVFKLEHMMILEGMNEWLDQLAMK